MYPDFRMEIYVTGSPHKLGHVQRYSWFALKGGRLGTDNMRDLMLPILRRDSSQSLHMALGCSQRMAIPSLRAGAWPLLGRL